MNCYLVFSISCKRRMENFEKEDLEKAYLDLKEQVIKEAGSTSNFSMEEVKDFYSKNINSKRCLAKVRSLQDIFLLLEKRNYLNSKDITFLQKLGDLLMNDKIKDHCQVYKKLHLDSSNNPNCTVCGICPVTEPLREHRDSHSYERNNLDVEDDLAQALQNVALNIGEKWGVLARELDIKECDYDECIARHPNDTVKQARMGLEFWIRGDKENASLAKLDAALEARLCKKEGFGVHLRSPRIILSQRELC